MKKNVSSESKASRLRLRRTQERARPVNAGLSTSSLDLAILGAVLALISSKAGSANADGVVLPPPDRIDASSPESFGRAVHALSGASAEVMVLAALAENLHRDLTRSLRESTFSSPVVVSDSAPFDWSADPTYPTGTRREVTPRSVVPAQEQASIPEPQLVAARDANMALVQEAPKLDANPIVAERSYGQGLDSMQKAAQELLGVMREMFGQELESVQARQLPNIEITPDTVRTEVAVEEAVTPAADKPVADATSDGPPTWLASLGLLGLGGGGGGGGGIGSSILSAATGVDFGGFAIDGYVSGATVFWDQNGNFIQDANETVQSTTKADGSYSLQGVTKGVGQIVIKGDGIDTNTGGSVGMMAASTSVSDATKAMVTPLTLLMAQGVSESSVKTALGLTANVSLTNYDPMSVLKAGVGDTQSAGTVLLKAQQLFAVVNAVSGLAASVSGSQADALKATISAISQKDLSTLVGANGGDATALSQVIASVVPTYASAATVAANAIKGVNSVLGELLANPSNALSTDARAAALVSQNDLVTQFKGLAELDPAIALTQITAKLANYATADLVKQNFANIYSETIAAQDRAGGGVITGVDDKTIVLGTNRLIKVSDLLANDVNRGTGSLKLVSVEPNLNWTGVASVSSTPKVSDAAAQVSNVTLSGKLEAGDSVSVTVGSVSKTYVVQPADVGANDAATAAAVATKLVTELGNISSTGASVAVANNVITVTGPAAGAPVVVSASAQNRSLPAGSTTVADNTQAVAVQTTSGHGDVFKTVYELDVGSASVNSARATGGYVKLNMGAFTVQVRADVGETAAHLVTKLIDAAKEQAPTLKLTSTVAGKINVESADGSALSDGVNLQAAVKNDALDARLVTLDNEQYVQVDAAAVGQFNLRYVVSNDAGQGVGTVRLTTVPEVQTVGLQTGSASQINEDTTFILGDRVDLTGNLSTGVTQSLFVKLNNVGMVAAGTQFTIKVGTEAIRTLTVGESFEVKALPNKTLAETLDLTQVAMPTNYHGGFKFQYTLVSSTGSFSTSSTAAVDTLATVATAVGDTPALKLQLGAASAGDVTSDLVVPLVLNPNATQSTRFQLVGGDVAFEQRFVQLSNLPSGMRVLVGNGAATNEVFTDVTDQIALGRLTIQEPVAGQSFGVKFLASTGLIDANFGLSADPVTVVVFNREPSTGDVAYGAEATFKFDVGGSYGLTVTAQALTVSPEDVAALIGQLDVASVSDGATVKAVIRVPTGVKLGRIATDGSFTELTAGGGVAVANGTYTLTATSANATTFLDGLGVQTASNFKGTVTVDATVSAYKGVTDVLLASFDKTMQMTFAPVADGVTGYAPATTELIALEDNAISLHNLFFSGAGTASPLAALTDSSETLTYVVKNLPAGSRLVDGSTLTGSGESLRVAIAQANSIGRVVGDGIELTAAEANVANLVLGSNVSLASGTSGLTLYAYSQESGSAVVSAYSPVGGATVPVSFTAVADAPYLSMDAQVRGLANVAGLSADLQAKTKIEIPASAALTDTDGSESLWVRITPVNASNTAIATTGFVFTGIANAANYSLTSGSYVVKASELASLRVSSGTAFTGKFKVDAISVEGAPTTAAAARTIIDAAASNTIAVTSQDLAVQFLQPATTPVVTFGGLTPSLSTVAKSGGTEYDLTFKVNVTSGESDKVTVLMTGVPSTAGDKAKFYIIANGVEKLIGAPAEVSGVWVFNASELRDASGPVTVHMVLPSGYVNTNTVFDVTAFAVDSLGLTNAKSSTLTSAPLSLSIPSAALDPVIIDTAGDGLALTNATTKVAFDLNGDGTTDQVGWVTGKDDAFLVLRKDANKDGVFEDNVTNGNSLATENLVSPVTTDAIADLRTFDDNHDGILTKAELVNHGLVPQLWFDNATAASTANGVAVASELADVSSNFSINLATYNDTATRDAGGALLAGSIAPGGVTGTFTLPSGTAKSLSTARTFDVFLPVATTTTTAQSTMAAFAKTEIEDAPSGIDLSAALVGADWQSQFGTAWTDGIAQGANVLLTVRAKEAGTTFNLSQGARLDGQATDTWLLLWKPQEAASLKLFAKDNFSGLMDLEMRATVVYTSGMTPVSYTVSRDLGLTVTPMSDRPDLAVPDTFAAVNETDVAAGQDIELTGLKLAARDGSETVSLVFTPTTTLPSGSYFKYKGAVINADATTGKFTITGQVAASDVQLHVPAYASGTFGFNVTAMSRDGTAPASQIDNIPLTVRVAPVAQAPVVTLTAAQAAVTETVREFAVTLQATPVDPDGSEEVASVKLLVSNANLPFGSTFVVGSGATAVTYAFASTTVAGQFELVLPKSALTAGTGLAKTLTGKIVTPAYFDGSLSVQASATTVEKADATLQATSALVGTTVTITPVTDGLSAFVTKGLSVNAGEEIALSKLVTSLTKLDADESLTLTVSGIPTGAILYKGGVAYAVVGGTATIANASLEEIAKFKLVTGTLQTDFVLTVTASSKDDAAAAVDVVKAITIASVPLLEPVIVKSNGSALVDGKLGLSFNEGTSGILDVGVTVGSKLNPATATVTLSGVPTGIKVYSVASNTELSAVAVNATTNIFVLNATALSQGLRLVVPSTADASLVDFSGKVDLSLSTSVVYGGVTKTTVTPTTLLIQPVTDGLSFTTSIARAEDQSWSVSDLLGKKDSSETLSSVTIANNANLTVWVNNTQMMPTNGSWKLVGTDIANAVLKTVANYHGPLNLGLTTVSQDAGTSDTTVAAALTQNASVAVNLSAVADTPVVTGNAESQVQLFSSNARTSLLTEAVINDGRVDTGANLNLAIRLAAVTSTDPQETLTTVLTGSAIGSGVSLQFTTAAGATQNLSSILVGGKWQISVPSAYTTAALDATLLIPKTAGYGARELTVTAQTVDGTSVNTTVVDTDSFTILSTIPPQPVVGVLPEVKGADLSLASTLGLKLTDLVRVPMLNESVVLELIGLTPGVLVKVGSTVLNAVSPALSTVDGAALTAVRLTAAQLETARVVLPTDVVNGSTALSFSARSGSSDGFVVNPVTGLATSEVRYVYSRLVDADVHLNASTAGDDHVVVQATSVDVGAGDDTVVVDGKGNGALYGGEGTDTLSLAGLQDGALVDLNFGKMVALSAGNAVQTNASAVRAVSGFEVLVGSAASDTLVSNGESTVAMTLRGRGGDDILVGGAGNDLIEGGSGADELTGGAGVDTFVLAKGSGQDTVMDFNQSQDKIMLAGFGLNFGVGNSLPDAVHLATSTGGDWVVSVDDATIGASGAQLLLKGSASVSQADILSRLSFDDTHDWANGDVHASDFQMPVDAQTLAVSNLAREVYLGDNYDFNDLGSMLSVIADARFEKALAVNLNTHLGTINDLGDMTGYKGFAGTAYDDVLVGNDQSAVLLGGSGGSDLLVGGAARDILVAGAKTLADGMHVTDELTGGGGADMFVFVKSASNYDAPDTSKVDQTLHKIYEVNVTDFNREEGDRIVAVGYGDSVDAIKIDNVDANSNTQAVHFSDSLTVYFDLSFAREFDSNFSLRMADFDKV